MRGHEERPTPSTWGCAWQRWRAIPDNCTNPVRHLSPPPLARQIDRSHMTYLIMVLIATCRLGRTRGCVTNPSAVSLLLILPSESRTARTLLQTASSGGGRFDPPPRAGCVPWLPARYNVIGFSTDYGRMLGRHVSCLWSISRNVEVLARLARGAGEPSLTLFGGVEGGRADPHRATSAAGAPLSIPQPCRNKTSPSQRLGIDSFLSR